MTSRNDNRLSYEWANRPDDQRFLTIEALQNAVSSRADRSIAHPTHTHALAAIGTEEGELFVNTEVGPLRFSNWSFSQLASAAKAPASYLRNLPAPLAADNLNFGLRHYSRDESLILADRDDNRLRALTSATYGRIWDIEVVNAVIKVNENSGGIWKIPAASYATSNPKRATTLYASDRDVFIFLCDDAHPIELNGEQLFRGFYVWNSEVGAAVFGIATFLYRYICDNRIIWGQSHKNELRIRHTGGAPDRFIREATPALKQYAAASTEDAVQRIKRAKALEVGKTQDDVLEWIKKQGFTASFSKRVYETALAEEGRAASVWEISNGISAVARSVANTDARIDLEKKAGRLLDLVA